MGSNDCTPMSRPDRCVFETTPTDTLFLSVKGDLAGLDTNTFSIQRPSVP